MAIFTDHTNLTENQGDLILGSPLRPSPLPQLHTLDVTCWCLWPELQPQLHSRASSPCTDSPSSASTQHTLPLAFWLISYREEKYPKTKPQTSGVLLLCHGRIPSWLNNVSDVQGSDWVIIPGGIWRCVDVALKNIVQWWTWQCCLWWDLMILRGFHCSDYSMTL